MTGACLELLAAESRRAHDCVAATLSSRDPLKGYHLNKRCQYASYIVEHKRCYKSDMIQF